MKKNFTTSCTCINISLRKLIRFLILIGLLFSIFQNKTFAQLQWDGDHGVGNFSAPENWYSNTSPATTDWNSNNPLQFNNNNAKQTSTYFDLGSWKDVKSILFASSYQKPTSQNFVTLDAQPDGLGGKYGFNFWWQIENNSSFKQVISAPLSFKGTQMQLNPVNGDLEFNQNLPIYNDAKIDYDVWGNNNHHLILDNRPYGDGSTNININEYSIVEIANNMAAYPECFAGGVNINTGELWFDAGSSINGGTITVGGGNSNTAKVFLNDGDGGLTITNSIVVPAGSTNSHIGGLNSSGVNTYSGSLTLNGSVNLEASTGGIVAFSGVMSGSGNVTIQPVTGTNATVQYTGSSKAYSGTTTIKNGAILQISSNQSLGNISLEAGGTLIVDNGVALTITGTWSGGGTLINNGTIILQGPASFPGSTTTVNAMNNLTLNKSGSTTLDNNITISGQYNLTQGVLNIGSQNLTFDNTATIVNGNSPGASNMIQADGTGKVIKNFSAAGSFTFPIGDNTGAAEYSPATINLTSVTGTPSVSMNVVNAKHPQNNASTNYLNRYWRVTSTGTFTGDATFTYVTGDVVGTESSLITAGWNGAPNNYWNLYNNTNSVTHTLSATGLSDFNRDFTGGDKFASAAVYFKSNQTGNWNSFTSWLMSTDNITWVDAVSIPDQNALGITIQNSHKITLTADTSARKLRVDAGGILDLGGNTTTSSGNQLTIYDDGTTASDFDIYGTLVLYGKNISYNNSSAKTTVYAGGLVRADNNDSPGNSDEFAKSSQVFFNNNSIFQWNTTNAFSSSGVTFFPNASVSTIPYFVISKSVTVGGGSSTTINGLTIINANTTFQSGGNKIFRNGIAGNATLTQDGGIDDPGNFQITGNNAILGGAGLILNLTEILNIDTDVEVPVDSIITINKQTGKKTSGKILKVAVVFTVNGTADMTTINMSNGSGSVVINGYLKTAAPDGLKDISSGASPTFGGTTGGTVTVNTNSTIEYNGVSDQKITSSGNLAGTAPYYNLVLSGGGTKTPGSTIYLDVNGSLKITGTSTVVDASSNNIGPNNTTNSTSFTMDGGRLKLGTLGFTGSGTLPSMKGTYNLTGGVIEFLGGTSSRSQSIRSGSGFQYFNIEISGSYVGTSGGHVNIKNGAGFKIKNNGVFTINANSITGANTPSTAYVEVEGGGTFHSGNNGGFNGRVPTTETTSSINANITNIILDPNSTIAYTRSVPPLTEGDGSQPITTGSSFTYQNLTLSGTGNKIAPLKADLPINGNFTVLGDAQFAHDSSTVIFTNTTQAQNINASGVTYPPVFYNLKNQNTQNLNINNFISVKNELTLNDNSKINLKDIICLISDADATASVAPIPDAASIAYDTKGAFEVERFIPNHSKAWQLLSVPTKGSTIFNSWQNSGSSTPKRGVNITSPYWTSGDPKGFDGYSQGHSMKTYDPATDSYVGVTNTGNQIANPNGYFLFVRGDRSVVYGDPATEVTLQTSGKLYAPTPGGETPPDITVPPNTFAMVGNPYASVIKYDQISLSSNLQADYYIWDPQLTTGPYSIYGLGGFRTITFDDSKSTPTSGNYIDGNIPPIQSGQAFFVYNPSSTSGTVSFTENAKVSGSRSIFRGHKKVPVATASIQSGLEVIDNDEPTVLDGALQLFGKEYSNATDQYDAKKLMNSAENIMISASPYPLAIERRLLPEEKDTTFLVLTGLGKRTYRLTLTVKGMQQGYLQPILNDKYLNSTQPLAEGETTIGFTVGNDKLLSDKNRFYITYKTIPKPFSFDNENAVNEDESIRLKWEGHNQENVKSYAIEQSMDTIQFNTIGNTPAVHGTDASYSWTDYPEKEGVHYYRVKAFLNNGESIVSEIVSSAVAFKTPSLLLYPNPAIDHLRLRLTRKETGDYVVRIQQPDGKYVYSKIIHHNVHSNEYKISLPVLAAGIYNVEIISPAGLKEIKRVFIKK